MNVDVAKLRALASIPNNLGAMKELVAAANEIEALRMSLDWMVSNTVPSVSSNQSDVRYAVARQLLPR